MATTAALIKHLAKFPDGLTFAQIQRYIVESNGLDYDKQAVINQWEVSNGEEPRYRKQYRGYWCDRLSNGTRYFTVYNQYGHAHSTIVPKIGFLQQYCNKVGKQYILKEIKCST